MNKATANIQASEPTTDVAVHPLKKSYKFISTKHVDYENLTAMESVTMSLALVLAILAGLTFVA